MVALLIVVAILAYRDLWLYYGRPDPDDDEDDAGLGLEDRNHFPRHWGVVHNYHHCHNHHRNHHHHHHHHRNRRHNSHNYILEILA